MAEIHSVEGLAAYAHRQIERIERMQRDLAAQVGQGSSSGGHVTATTGAEGVLQDLRIDPAAMGLTAEELAAEVRAAIKAAQSDYAQRADDIMGPILHAPPAANPENPARDQQGQD